MRVTFILLRRGYVRNFASCIEGLLARGHDVHLGFDTPDHTPTGIEERLARRHGHLTWDAPPHRRDRWTAFLQNLRGMIDLIRYFHPDYRDAAALRQRIFRKAEPRVAGLRLPLHLLFGVRRAWWVRLATGVLRWIQFRLPVAAEVRAYLQSTAPDVVVVSPLINFASHQVDYIQAADRLGIPTIAAIASWDNLTNKGLLRCRPDRVLVWNRLQQRELERYHYVPAARVGVTGAHTLDKWLGRQPSRSRAAFLARVGLAPCADYVVFVCSSGFISRDEEAAFVRRWIAAIRGSGDSSLRDLGILVRPHFQNAAQWAGRNLTDLGNVAVYPPAGANPVDPDSEADFFDTIYFARAVVGLNTTAMVEAGLIGRPVMTIETEQFSGTQSGSLHFRYLREGGLLSYAGNLEQHLEQLRATLSRPPAPDANRTFVDYFIRPPDGTCTATELMVREIEAVAVRAKAPSRPGFADPLVRALLYPAAVWMQRRAQPKPLKAPKPPRAKVRKTRKVRKMREAARSGLPDSRAAE